MNWGNEVLYVYSVFLSTNLVDYADYLEWLNNSFLEDGENKNELLLNLELATSDKCKTLDILREYLYEKIQSLDGLVLGKLMTEHVRRVYQSKRYSIEQLSHTLYEVWKLLPNNIDQQEPFHMMSYIDDPLSYGDVEQTITLIERFVTYYD